MITYSGRPAVALRRRGSLVQIERLAVAEGHRDGVGLRGLETVTVSERYSRRLNQE